MINCLPKTVGGTVDMSGEHFLDGENLAYYGSAIPRQVILDSLSKQAE